MPQVHHITPGRSDKNFGKSVNDLVRGLPEDDWVCLRDIDTIPAYHETFFSLCEKIASSGKADMVGCMTNRVGLPHLLHGGKISDNFNYLYHRNIGKQLAVSNGAKVDITDYYIAGFFMLFPKKTWTAIGGFPENGIMIDQAFVDWHVCDKVSKLGLKIGIARGIYVFHAYRCWKNVRDTKHLI